MPTATVRITVITENTMVQMKIDTNGFLMPSSCSTRRFFQPVVTV